MPENRIITSPKDVEKHIYSIMEADAIHSEDDVLNLPRVVYYADADVRKVLTYKLRAHGLPYWVDSSNNCIRRTNAS